MFDTERFYDIIEERDEEISQVFKAAQRKIRAIAREMTTEEIIEVLMEMQMYDDEDICNHLQDELEGRDKAAFDAWHDEQCPPVWEHLPNFFTA